MNATGIPPNTPLFQRPGSAPVISANASRYVLYARKSTEGEDRQVQSIEDQVKACREIAARHGLNLVEVVTESKSAKRHGTRPGFKRLLDLLETRQADGVIAWHPDRLARNAVDGGWVMDLLDRRKLRDLRFATFTFENTPEGKFMLGMLFTKGKYDVDKLSVDVHRGMQSRREKGGFPHRAPEGYLNDRNTRTVVADPVRFPLVRRAVDAILSGTMTPADAWRALNGAWGYRTRPTKKNGGGGPLAKSVFYRMLENPFYAGECRTQGGAATYRGTQPPLMTRAEFTRLQEIVGREASGDARAPRVSVGPERRRRRRHDFPFTGLMRCGRCGAMVTATLSKGHTYYHCTNRAGNCDRRGVRGERVYEQLYARLEALSVPREFEELLNEVTARHLAAAEAPERAARDARERALAEARRRSARLVSLVTKGLLGEEEFVAEREMLRAQIGELERKANPGGPDPGPARAAARAAVGYAAHAARAFEESSPADQRAIASTIGSDMILTAGRVLLETNPVLAAFLGQPGALPRFKPRETRSQRTKKTATGVEVLFGSDDATVIKPQQVRANQLTDQEREEVERIAKGLAHAIKSLGPDFSFPYPDCLPPLPEPKGKGRKRKDGGYSYPGYGFD